MNILSLERKIHILNGLIEGASIRSVERMTHTHRDTICRLLRSTGERCQAIMDAEFRGIQASEFQVDEIWSYVGKRDRRLNGTDGPEVGSQYIFVAMEANTKLIPSFAIGKRDLATATALMKDLAGKVSTRIQLTTDSFPGFSFAVAEAFGRLGIDYGQLTKKYNGADTPRREGYSPSQFIRVRKVPVMGNPDIGKISTSFIERQNLTMRMQMRRLTRLTNAFSKKIREFTSGGACSLLLVQFWANTSDVADYTGGGGGGD